MQKLKGRRAAHEARFRRLENRLNDVLELLGAKEMVLPVDDWEISNLFRKAHNTLKRGTQLLTAEEVMWWARVLLAIDENYLVIAAFHLKTREPWFQLLWLANRMMERAPTELYDAHRELQVAYSYLDYARRSFRQVAYFYCRVQLGPNAANKKFPEAQDGDVTRAISRLISMALAEGVNQKLGKTDVRNRMRPTTSKLH